MNNIYITVLDFLVPEVTQYQFIDNKNFHDLDIENFLKNKGHDINNVTYMVHENTINKIHIKN